MLNKKNELEAHEEVLLIVICEANKFKLNSYVSIKVIKRKIRKKSIRKVGKADFHLEVEDLDQVSWFITMRIKNLDNDGCNLVKFFYLKRL